MRIVLVALVVGSLVSASAAAAYFAWSLDQPQRNLTAWTAPGYGGWMMGNGGFQQTVTSQSASTTQNGDATTTATASASTGSVLPSGTVGVTEAIAMMRTPPSYARVNATSNTITFDSQKVSIFVLAMMPDEAANITGSQPPRYASGDVFVIYGLMDPTLVLQRDTVLNVMVVNLDNDMYHNFIFTSLSPPYSAMMMANGGMGPGMMYNVRSEFLSMMPLMPPANYAQGYAFSYSYALNLSNSGSFWYACTYPGHAQSGMYGQIRVS